MGIRGGEDFLIELGLGDASVHLIRNHHANGTLLTR